MRISNIAVIGAGTMGHALAQVFALAGLHVALMGKNAEVLGTAVQRIQANLETCLKHNSVDEDRAASVPERITLTSNLADAASQAGFIVEAVFEDLDVKHEVLRRLEEHCRTGTVITSTTSG